MKHDDIARACRAINFLPPKISQNELDTQIKLFLRRLHGLIASSPEENLNNTNLLKKFLVTPELYQGVPDLMHCILACHVLAPVESVVESIGSVLKHHNKVNRNLKEENLNFEMVIAWNGPSIPNCDSVVENTLNRMFSGSSWHFIRSSDANKLKFYKVSEAVDKLQNTAKKYMFD